MMATKTTTKKAEPKKTTAKKASVEEAPVKTVAAEPVKETVETKAVKEETVKAAPAKKTTEKPAEKAPAKKAAAKKPAAKRTTEKKAEATVNTEVYVQFWGKEIVAKEVVANIKKIWTDEMGKPEAELVDLKVYIKPEENGAHYVINGDIRGFIGL